MSDIRDWAKVLTARQRELLALIEQRRRHRLPAVQRDLAEAMGIRRDSHNKLLARTRRVLDQHGVKFSMPPRSRGDTVAEVSLSTLEER